MTIVVHGDFTDARSHIASRRLDALAAAGIPVEWRAVRAHPSLTVTQTPMDAVTHRYVDATREWLRDNALAGAPGIGPAPRFTPSATPAISAFAEGVVAGIADHVRQRLFAHYWVDHEDIGNPDVLRRLLTLAFLHGRSPSDVVAEYGYAVAISGAPITSKAWLLTLQWQAECDALGHPELPLLTADGTTLEGYAALTRLGELVTSAAGSVRDREPATLPPMPVGARWLSIERPGRRPLWRDG